MPDTQGLLLEIWKQSRADLEAAQERFRKSIQFLLGASFAITAFLLSEKSPLRGSAMLFSAAADLLLLLAFSVMFVLAIGEIRLARATVEWYQGCLKGALGSGRALAASDLFPGLPAGPRMFLRNEVLSAVVAAAVVAIKALLLVSLKNG
jgi:hypothetical protein